MLKAYFLVIRKILEDVGSLYLFHIRDLLPE